MLVVKLVLGWLASNKMLARGAAPSRALQIPVLELKRVEGSGVPRLDDFPELEKAAVDE